MEFCVECGSEEKLYGHLCKSCLLSKDLIKAPTHISVVVCRSCDKTLKGSRWSDVSLPEEAGEILRRETETHSEVSALRWEVPDFVPEKGEHRLECDVIANIGDEELTLPFKVSVKILMQTCDVCSRQKGDYYEAILQLRREGLGSKGSDRELKEADAVILRLIDELGKGDKMGFLTKSGKVSGGIDYYLGSMALARSVSRRFRDSLGAGITESSSLVGKKDGKELFRWTILIRLPSYRKIDVVSYDKELYTVVSVSRKHLDLRHLLSGKRVKVQTGDVNLKLIAMKEDLETAVVVSKDKDTVQVLDPGNMRTVTLSRPSTLEDVGESVAVVRHNEDLFIV